MLNGPGRRGLVATLVPVAALALAGCVSTVPGTATAPAEVAAAKAQLPSTAAPSSTPPATTSPAALPDAVDGRDTAACADGRCEVRVREDVTIEPDPELGISVLAVGAISGGTVTMGLVPGPGPYSIETDGDPNSTLNGSFGSPGSPPSATATGGPGFRVTVNSQVVEVVAVRKSAAVLRLRTK